MTSRVIWETRVFPFGPWRVVLRVAVDDTITIGGLIVMRDSEDRLPVVMVCAGRAHADLVVVSRKPPAASVGGSGWAELIEVSATGELLAEQVGQWLAGRPADGGSMER